MSDGVPTKVISEIQKLEPDAQIELFQLDCSIFGGIVYLFHNQRVQGAGTINFGGLTYQPIPMEASGFAHNGTEQSPTPQITMSDITGLVRSLVKQYDNLTGATVRRIRTFRKWLDDGTEPDSTARLSDDLFFVNRKPSASKHGITFELDSSLNVDGAKVPNRRVFGRCQVPSVGAFKDGVNCPYVGPDGSCTYTVDDCATKFGPDVDLPFLGYPAVERISLEG